MFKNKDGSYNKLQLLIISLIGLIGTGIIISIAIPDIQNIDINPLYLIGLFLLILIIWSVWNNITKNQNVIQTQTPLTKAPHTKYQEETRTFVSEIDKPKSLTSIFSLGIITPLITVVVGIMVVIIIGNIMNSVISTLPPIQEGSPWSNTTPQISNISGAFNLMGLALPLIGIIILFKSLSRFFK